MLVENVGYRLNVAFAISVHFSLSLPSYFFFSLSLSVYVCVSVSVGLSRLASPDFGGLWRQFCFLLHWWLLAWRGGRVSSKCGSRGRDREARRAEARMERLPEGSRLGEAECRSIVGSRVVASCPAAVIAQWCDAQGVASRIVWPLRPLGICY